ncbi:MAG: acetylxylan esterase [Candidatus Handelsmanbacteria bacterium]|nr:acetylxylan esterase [Candidatus Handelsmanbacteria bacterium]
MSTRLLDARRLKELQPSRLLWQLYRPEEAPHRFAARTPAQGRAWQVRTRRALGQTLGLSLLRTTPLAPKKLESVDRGDHLREKLLLRTAPGVVMPVYLLLPKKAPRPLPVVVAFHGHGYGVKDIVGLWEDGAERREPDGYHRDFGVALCRRGFAVAAPEISCFGERQTDFSYLEAGQSSPGTCTHTSMLAFHLGLSTVGLRVHDGLRLVDYLQARRDLDTSRLGAMGISGGGMHTLFSTCMDERIKACVVSGYFCTFRDSILAMHHCPCNFVPGLHQFGEMHDLAGLLAPRPLLVEAASRDPIFPIRAVKKSVQQTRQHYQVWDDTGQVETDYFEGRHQISGRRAYDFLWEKLQRS